MNNPPRPLIMANWKMNLSTELSVGLAQSLLRKGKPFVSRAEIVVFPSYLALPAVAQALKSTTIALGAQDMCWSERGNFTGEVSPIQLVEAGCHWALIGHSERREYCGETDDMIDRKTSAAIRYGITPVVCVGETRDERRAGTSELRVDAQIRAAFRYVRAPLRGQRIIVAYEPRWAISPGLPCEPADAKAMAEVIRQTLVDLYDSTLAVDCFTIVYGGSVDHHSIKEYLDDDILAGALIGQATLTADSFVALLDALPARQPRPINKAPKLSKPIKD